MKPIVPCLLLLSACELEAASNYDTYKLTWSCQSPEGCERAEQVELIDRVLLFDNDEEYVEIFSSGDTLFREDAQRIASDDLPAGCSWLYGLALFTYELEPSRFCRTSGGFEFEVSIPNRDLMTHSQWLVKGRK
jgi:hypothetical protein